MRPLVALLALAALGCSGRRDPALLVVSGHVEATEVRVATRLAGRLESLDVREGDRVEAGSRIALVETTDARLLRAQVAAERDQASADLKLREAGYRQEDIAELQAEVRAVAADLAGATRDLERMEGLLARGSGTTKARDDARTRRDALAARLEARRAALRRLRAGFRGEEIEAARARLRALEARLAQIDNQIADAAVASPVAGVVTETLAERGEFKPAGATLAVVADLARPWLTVYVPEPDLGRIRLGQEVEVATDGGETRTGRVTFIAGQAEFTPKNVQTRDERVKLVFRVKIGLDSPDLLFKPGMPAEARIRLAPGAGGRS